MPSYCRCPHCHAHLVADLRRALDYGDDAAVAYLSTDGQLHIPPMVELNGGEAAQLEALVSLGCTCHRWHESAIRERLLPRPPYKPPTHWKKEEDE